MPSPKKISAVAKSLQDRLRSWHRQNQEYLKKGMRFLVKKYPYAARTLKEKYREQGGKCIECRRPISLEGGESNPLVVPDVPRAVPVLAVLDHTEPLRSIKTGEATSKQVHSLSNARWMCPYCNHRKNGHTLKQIEQEEVTGQMARLKEAELNRREQGKFVGYSRKGRRLKYEAGSPSPTQTAVSENTSEGLSFEQALNQMRSANQKAFKDIIKKASETIGVKPHLEDAIGDWTDGAEHSVLQKIHEPVDERTADYLAAWYGLLANQKSVLVFQPTHQGPDSTYEVEIPDSDLARVREHLNQAGIPFRTIVPTKKGTRVVVYDEGNQFRDNIAQFGAAYNAQIHQSQGRGRFIGGSTRTHARSKYRRIITSYEARNGRSAAGRYAQTEAGPIPSSIPPGDTNNRGASPRPQEQVKMSRSNASIARDYFRDKWEKIKENLRKSSPEAIRARKWEERDRRAKELQGKVREAKGRTYYSNEELNKIAHRLRQHQEGGRAELISGKGNRWKIRNGDDVYEFLEDGGKLPEHATRGLGGESPVQESRVQAPVGGMLVRGLFYPGGRMIPSKDYSGGPQLTGANQVIDTSPARKKEARSYEAEQRARYARGDYAGALQAESDRKERVKYAANGGLTPPDQPPPAPAQSQGNAFTRLQSQLGRTNQQLGQAQQNRQNNAAYEASTSVASSRLSPKQSPARVGEMVGDVGEAVRNQASPGTVNQTPQERAAVSKRLQERPWEDPYRPNAGSNSARAWGDVNSRLRQGIAAQNARLAEGNVNRRLNDREQALQRGPNVRGAAARAIGAPVPNQQEAPEGSPPASNPNRISPDYVPPKGASPGYNPNSGLGQNVLSGGRDMSDKARAWRNAYKEIERNSTPSLRRSAFTGKAPYMNQEMARLATNLNLGHNEAGEPIRDRRAAQRFYDTLDQRLRNEGSASPFESSKTRMDRIKRAVEDELGVDESGLRLR